MRNFIVTDKNVLLREFSDIGITHLDFRWKGTKVIGKQQLCEIILYEAQQRIKEKYLDNEIKNIFSEINIKSLKPNELKKLFKFIKFTE